MMRTHLNQGGFPSLFFRDSFQAGLRSGSKRLFVKFDKVGCGIFQAECFYSLLPRPPLLRLIISRL
jgi:hypothetical protein